MMAAVIPLPVAPGASADDWSHLDIILGLTEDLLPVVSNSRATISPTSTMKEIGKTPSTYNGQRQVIGFKSWTQYKATAADVEQWAKERDYGVCLQTRRIRAIDIDINDEQALEVRAVVERHLGNLPCRRRGNAEKVLLAIDMPGEFYKRKIKTATGIIEFLAGGQQFICCGTHPSGARYEWESGLPDEFPIIEQAAFERMWADLAEQFAVEAPTESGASTKHEKLASAISSDPVAQRLSELGMVKKVDRSGAIHIVCPFEEGHSTESADSSTTYFPAHTGGYERGHFHCLHASCQGRTDEDYKVKIGYVEETTLDFENLEDAEVEATPEAFMFKVHSVREFCTVEPTPWIVKGILPQAELGVLFGESGSGKSFLALDLAAAIAQGTEWRGHKVAKGRVLFVAAEGSGGFRKRLKAYCQVNGLDMDTLDIGVIDAAPNLMDKAIVNGLGLSIRGQGGADVVFIDTLAQTMHGANENSSEDMGKIISHVKALHRGLKSMVMLIHHAGKDTTKGARGWSGLRAACDVELEVARVGDVRALYVSKQKDAEDGLEFGFKLHQVLVGVDADGDAITSCVVEHTEESLRDKKQGKTPTGKNEKFVLEVLSEMVGLTGAMVMRSDLRETAIDKFPEGEDGKRHRPGQAVDRAIDSLVKGGFVREEGKCVGF